MSNNPSIDYETLFRQLPDGHIIVEANDPVFTVVAQNDEHVQISLTEPGEVIGKPFLEAFPDTSEHYLKTGKSEVLESIRTAIATKRPDNMPVVRYDLKDHDGKMVPRYWRATHFPILDENGAVARVFQATKDITSEVSAERRLRNVERQLERALSVGGVCTWSWEISTNKVYGDDNLAHLFGYEPKDTKEGLSIKKFVESIHPEDRHAIHDKIKHTLETGEAYEAEYRTISRDGSTHWVIARGSVERDQDGKIINFPGAIIDITERKLAENNLRYLVKTSTVLASSLDYEQTLKSVAELTVPQIADWCTVELLDDKRKELRLVALVHKDEEKVAWAEKLREEQGPTDLSKEFGVAQVIRTGEPEMYSTITDELLERSAKSKKELEALRNVGMSAAIIVPLTVGKKTIGVISMISAERKRHYTQFDLDTAMEVAKRASFAIENALAYEKSQRELKERKRLQKKLAESNEKLERRVQRRTRELERTNLSLQRSNRELENFAYVASHDLQEPLRKIQAFGNLLEDEFSEQLGEGADYLDRMRNAAVRMSALINDLLSFSRVATKKEPLSEVDLSVIVSEVLGDLENLVERTNGLVTVEPLPVVMADPTQMRQLFQNLIGNALKFHRKDISPVVTVSSQEIPDDTTGNGAYEIKIHDNGVGFDEKYLDRIFAVFQRLNGRDEYEGTGIGLAVVRKIIERHNGTITAESTPGSGATFIVTLPKLHDKKGEEL